MYNVTDIEKLMVFLRNSGNCPGNNLRKAGGLPVRGEIGNCVPNQPDSSPICSRTESRSDFSAGFANRNPILCPKKAFLREARLGPNVPDRARWDRVRLPNLARLATKTSSRSRKLTLKIGKSGTKSAR